MYAGLIAELGNFHYEFSEEHSMVWVFPRSQAFVTGASQLKEVWTSVCNRSMAPDQPPNRSQGGQNPGWKAGFPTVFHHQLGSPHSLLLQGVDCIKVEGNGQKQNIADTLENVLC